MQPLPSRHTETINLLIFKYVGSVVYFNVEVISNGRMYGSNAYPTGNELSLQKANFHLYCKTHIINSAAGLGLKIKSFI